MMFVDAQENNAGDLDQEFMGASHFVVDLKIKFD